MSNLVLLNAFFPEVQQKIFEEQQRIFTSTDEEVTESHVNQMTYLETVIKEGLRFWPSVPITMRSVSKDLQIGDFLVPQGTTVFIPIMHIHRNKKDFGEDADEFRPDRFAPENLHKINLEAFMPFSRIPRNCIGHRYAMIMIKLMLSYIFRRYKVTTSMKLEDMKFEFIISCNSADGYNVTMEPRSFEPVRNC